MKPFGMKRHFPVPARLAVKAVLVMSTLILSGLAALGGPPPPGWHVTALGRGTLVTNAVVDYEAGTWNVKTGPTRSAIVCQSLSGDLSVVMKVTDGSGQPNARIGIMTWSSLALTAGKAGLVMDPQGQKIYFSWDEASDRGSTYANFLQAEGIGFPVWLKLTRNESYFSAFYSKDGQEWRPVGVPVKTFWGGRRPEIYAGIYGDGICEQRVTDLAITPAPAVTLPAPLPEGWTMDVKGQPGFVGEARHDAGKWTLAGASPVGRGGYHNVTVLRTVPSKVQLTAKIRTAGLSDPRAGGGLLLSAHGVDAGIVVYPATARLTLFTRQTSTGRLLLNRSMPIPATLVGQAEAYLRLALVDARVVAFFGPDTENWTPVGEVITVNEMTADISGGMELSAGSGSRLITSVNFEDFKAEPITLLPGQPAPPPVAARPTTTPGTTPVLTPPTTPTPRPPVTTYPSRTAARTGIGIGGFLCFGAVLLVVVTLFLIKPFNRLVYLRNRTSKAWSQIDVQLKRRHDLILNYVEAVKGYAKHESSTLEGVARARSAAVNATSVGERAEAEAALNATMRSLYAVVEANPDLKANQNFLSLQSNLKETEDKLAAARNEYNEDVLTYNTCVQSFPTNLIAFAFRFKARDFFEVKEASQREAPRTGI